MDRGTNAQVWAAIGTTFMALGGAILVTLATTHHARAYDIARDPLLYVGSGAVLIGAYVFARLFAFPALWLPDVKTRHRLEVGMGLLAPLPHLSGSPELGVVHVRVVNHERQTLQDALLNASAAAPGTMLGACSRTGTRPMTQEIQQHGDDTVYVFRSTISGHGALADYYFAVQLDADSESEVGFAIVSDALPEPVRETLPIRRAAGPVEEA